MKIKNKTIIITGGSSGLGLELAKRLAVMNNNIVLIARDKEKLAKAEEEITSLLNKKNVLVFSVDVKKKDSVEKAFAKVVKQFKRIDILINSAGILLERKFEDMAVEDYQKLLDINFLGTIHTIKAALPELKKSKGSIVNIASMAGLFGVFGYSSYCASKHAVIGFTKSLGFELKQYGITVQAVCPPEFDSPMVAELDTYRSPENLAHASMIPKLKIQKIVDDTIRGIQNKKPIIIPGTLPKIADFTANLFPGLSQFLAEKRIQSVQKKYL